MILTNLLTRSGSPLRWVAMRGGIGASNGFRNRRDGARRFRAAAARAKKAAAAGRWPKVLEIWQALAQEFPGEADPLVGAAAALRELGRLDAAETVLHDAINRFPGNAAALIQFALVAILRGDWAEGMRRSEALRERFPALPEGYLGVAEALRQSGRLAESERVLGATATRFRSRLLPAAHHALAAALRQDWPEALRRWQRVATRFPHAVEGYIGAAEACAALGRPERADAFLAKARKRITEPYAGVLRLAEAAERLERWETAAAQWQSMRQRFPNEVPAYLHGAAALERLGRLAEADRVLQIAARRFAASEAIWLAAIRIAMALENRAEAVRRWRELLRHCPVPAVEMLPRRHVLRRQIVLSGPGFDAMDLAGQPWAPGTLICDNPVVILSNCDGFQIVEHTAPYYQGQTVHVFINMAWTLAWGPDYRRRFKEGYDRVAVQYPNFQVTVLANDAAELLQLRELGISGELVNEHAFLDDTVYDILPVEQTFDAIYNARVVGYKRHELAHRIRRLKLIIAGADREAMREARRLLPDSTIANLQGDELVPLDGSEVALHLNTAKCGLCLSRIEGGMFASGEYLLCGLPVVTTHNSGGRNWFFSNDYAAFCDDDAAAVAAAVAEIISRGIPRPLIRESARQRIRRERLVFFDLVNRVFRETGQEGRRIEPEFERLFCDKINYVGRPLSEFLVP